MQSKTWTLDWDDDEEITRPSQRGANVLVAEGDDDEPIARRLEDDGYDVHLAVSARDVLALLESARRDAFPCDRFDLLVLGDPAQSAATVDRIDVSAFGFTGTARAVFNASAVVTASTNLTLVSGAFGGAAVASGPADQAPVR